MYVSKRILEKQGNQKKHTTHAKQIAQDFLEIKDS